MYTAIIVEPRKHRALLFVLNNFLENLSNDWNIIIFHGNLNLEFINDIINNNLDQYKQRISLVNLGVDNLKINEYNDLFIQNRDFYNHIPTETFLVFQTDSMIFKKNSHLINEFLNYDYVGAPWPYQPKNGQHVGNGGLSLRKKTKMLEIMEKETETFFPEDVFFSCTNKVDLYKPTIEEAKRFSIENIFSEVSFGTHQGWLLSGNPRLYEIYPEIQDLLELQH
jgi:hypothetical protein